MLCHNNRRWIERWYNNCRDAIGLQLYTPNGPTCFRGDEPSYLDCVFISNQIDVINCCNQYKVPTLETFSNHKAVVYQIKCDRVQGKIK